MAKGIVVNVNVAVITFINGAIKERAVLPAIQVISSPITTTQLKESHHERFALGTISR